MTYFRLRDIKTPPFAYVVNKEEAIHSCELCQMPFAQPQETLRIEIFTTEAHAWESRLKGRPLMAEEWLIGDEVFRNTLEQHLPGMFECTDVEIVSWLARRPGILATEPTDILASKDHPGKPQYFFFRPRQILAIDERLVNSFPPISCQRCKRAIPEIPLEYQRLPELSGEQPMVASLEHFHMEGYDYLFHENILPMIKAQFPEMMLEELAPETLMI